MNVGKLRAAIALIVSTLTLSTVYAHSQVTANLDATGLAPQPAGLSPDMSVSPAPDGLAAHGGGAAIKHPIGGLNANHGAGNATFGLARVGSSPASLSSSVIPSKLAAHNVLSAPLPGSGTPTPSSSGARLTGGPSSLFSESSISPWASPRPSLGLADIGSPSLRAPRAPRKFPVQKSASERPLYSFMVQHETGKMSSMTHEKPGKRKSGIRSQDAIIQSALGGHRSH